jgi:hypothetical protein
MLLDFELNPTPLVIFGWDAELQVGRRLAAQGAKHVLIHTPAGFFMNPERYEEVKQSLTQEGIRITELSGVMSNPRLDLIQKGIALCREEKVDFILAIGGGSVIDSGKAIAAGVCYEGDVWDFCLHKAEVQKALPLAVILTYPASGSEGGGAAIILNTDGMLKLVMGSPLLYPKIVFMDPVLTFTLPKSLTAFGVVDMYSHIVERYFTPTAGFGVIDSMSEAIFRTLIDIGPKVLDDPANYELRAEIMWIGTIAHNDTVGVGRIPDWGSHTIAHELSGLYDTPHGVTLSIIMPAWMKYVYKHDVDRFYRYATEVFHVDPQGKNKEEVAYASIEKTMEFFTKMGMPTSFSQAGIPSDRLEEMAEKAIASTGNNTGNFVRLTAEDVLKIYQLAL